MNGVNLSSVTSSSPGRATRLDRHHVVRTALRLVEEVGLDGLTMRRLATELDVKAPALYWHFANKQELLDHVAHLMTLDWLRALPEVPAGAWDEWITTRARDYRRLLLSRRDGARLVAGTRPLAESFPLLDAAVGTFAQVADCRPGTALRCLVTVNTYVAGFVLEEQGELDREPDPAEQPGADPARLALLRSGRPAPHLSAAIDEVGAPSGEETFEYGLGLIVEGVRVRLA